MEFVKKLLFNILLYAVAAAVLYLLFPKMIGIVYELLWRLFGPWIVLLFIPAVLPAFVRKRSRK